MKTKSVVCALLIKGDKILLQDRKEISKYGEEWSFFGGGIEKNEVPEQALFREIKEELGFDISSWEKKYLGEIVHYTDFGVEYHRFLYGIKIPKDISYFEDKEGSGAYFFELDEAKKLKFNTPVTAEISQVKNNFLKKQFLI